MSRLSIAVMLLVTGACGSAPMSGPVCAIELDRIVANLSLTQTERAVVLENLHDSQWAWRRDPAFEEVANELQSRSLRAVIGLQVGRAPGGGYNSVWFIESAKGVEEIATGPEPGRVRRRNVPGQAWAALKTAWHQRTAAGVNSEVSYTMVDGPVYFVCSLLEGTRTTFVVRAMPTRNEQYTLLYELLSSSELTDVPIEIERAMVEPLSDVN